MYLLGGGNLVNLSCAEGHPSEVAQCPGHALAVCSHPLAMHPLRQRRGAPDFFSSPLFATCNAIACTRRTVPPRPPPWQVMATSFLGQALACEYIAKEGKTLKPGCMNLPEELDDEIASLQLDALGVKHDAPTKEQEEYAKAWLEGTE